ncbi:DUF2922 family protein [Desulfofundulus thermobenzoicus]|uniref:DUF2922 family protein n=1 Tax=Desulfofundulus thermobenzoicus TaxID=29376 RepID=A0A6N7IQU3_9FIRM|nr:DUF2922 domain-containing protein [Desulfofundulus thermobenzoicus]MQL52414.1 DUF2922 family protein [Desulfofundulus thermobenzoicus]
MTYLRLTFQVSDGTRKTLRVPDPKDDITKEQIQQGAQAIINANVFYPALTELVDSDVVVVTDLV